MGGLRPSLTARVSAGIMFALLVTLAATVWLHQARVRQALLTVTELRVSLIAGDLAARIQAELDLGLDLPALTSIQPILDTAAQGESRIIAVEVRGRDGELLFRGGAAAGADAASESRLAAIARSKPASRDGTDPSDDDQSGDQAMRTRVGGAAPAISWLDAGPGLVAARAGLVDIYGGDAGSLIVTYSRASVAGTARAIAARLARVALLLLTLAAPAVWLATRAAFRRFPAHGPGVRCIDARREDLTALEPRA